MQKIIIMSKSWVGMTGSYLGVGYDKGLNPFKKSLSASLQAKLAKELEESGIEADVFVGNSIVNLKAEIKEGNELYLISPFVKEYLKEELSDMDETNYYFVEEDDFLNTTTTNILKHIKMLNER